MPSDALLNGGRHILHAIQEVQVSYKVAQHRCITQDYKLIQIVDLLHALAVRQQRLQGGHDPAQRRSQLLYIHNMQKYVPDLQANALQTRLLQRVDEAQHGDDLEPELGDMLGSHEAHNLSQAVQGLLLQWLFKGRFTQAALEVGDHSKESFSNKIGKLRIGRLTG